MLVLWNVLKALWLRFVENGQCVTVIWLCVALKCGFVWISLIPMDCGTFGVRLVVDYGLWMRILPIPVDCGTLGSDWWFVMNCDCGFHQSQWTAGHWGQIDGWLWLNCELPIPWTAGHWGQIGRVIVCFMFYSSWWCIFVLLCIIITTVYELAEYLLCLKPMTLTNLCVDVFSIVFRYFRWFYLMIGVLLARL